MNTNELLSQYICKDVLTYIIYPMLLPGKEYNKMIRSFNNIHTHYVTLLGRQTLEDVGNTPVEISMRGCKTKIMMRLKALCIDMEVVEATVYFTVPGLSSPRYCVRFHLRPTTILTLMKVMCPSHTPLISSLAMSETGNRFLLTMCHPHVLHPWQKGK